MTEIFFRYLHFIGIMSLAGCLVIQHLLISKEIQIKEFKKIAFIDIIYGISAVLTLVGGLALWLYVGKESSFYTSNGVFHVKLSLFILIALLSIYPTLFFLRNKNKEVESIKMPKVIIMLIRMQLAILFILPLLGVLISRG
jgi:putative membrane protein